MRWPWLSIPHGQNRCLRLSLDFCTCLSLRVNELYVDDPDKDSGGKIDVSLNISLPNLHCEREYSSRPTSVSASQPVGDLCADTLNHLGRAKYIHATSRKPHGAYGSTRLVPQ